MKAKLAQWPAAPSGSQRSPSTSQPPLEKTRPSPYPSSSPRKAKGGNSTDKPFQKSFRDIDHPPLSHCHKCLGRDKHDIRKCSRTSLANGKREVLCDWNAQRYLEFIKGPHKGLEVCADWQRPNGCTSRNHSEKHRCSGCASTAHGAGGCPEGL